MTARVEPRGWCPSVFAPMAAHDGLLVRVKPRCARLSTDMAHRVAEAATACGNGRIELTSRGNLQIRGLTERSSDAFARAMVACGAADADPETERRRNIMVSPLAGDDPSIEGHPDTVAEALEHALRACDLKLPEKFGFAVDGAGVVPLGATGVDITLRTGAADCHVEIAGGLRAVVCGEADAVDVALDLARAFLRCGGRRRMRDLVKRIGEAAVYQAAGRQPCAASMPDVALAEPPVGRIVYSGGARGAFGWAPDGGEVTPAQLRSAADLAKAQGDGLLRTTPWRCLLMAGVDISRPIAWPA